MLYLIRESIMFITFTVQRWQYLTINNECKNSAHFPTFSVNIINVSCHKSLLAIASLSKATVAYIPTLDANETTKFIT
jgi:hypothetical protein